MSWMCRLTKKLVDIKNVNKFFSFTVISNVFAQNSHIK